MAYFPQYGQKTLPQKEVDKKRFDIAAQLIVSHVKMQQPNVPVHHIRFLDGKTCRSYQVREGNPPADTDRKPWERGLNLEIDVGYIHPSLARLVMWVRKKARSEGEVTPDKFMAYIKDALAGKMRESLYVPQIIHKPFWQPRERKMSDIPKSVLLNQAVSYAKKGYH